MTVKINHAVASLAMIALAILAAFLCYSLLDFDTSLLFPKPQIIAPVIGGTLLTYLSTKATDSERSVKYFLDFFRRPPAIKVAFIVFTILIIAGLFSEIMSWVIPPNEIDHGPCYRFSYGNCGTEDLNLMSRYNSQSIIFKVFCLLGLLLPAVLLNNSFRNWLEQDD